MIIKGMWKSLVGSPPRSILTWDGKSPTGRGHEIGSLLELIPFPSGCCDCFGPLLSCF